MHRHSRDLLNYLLPRYCCACCWRYSAAVQWAWSVKEKAALRKQDWRVDDIEIIKPETAEKPSLIALVSLRRGEAVGAEELLAMLRAHDVVISAEEM